MNNSTYDNILVGSGPISLIEGLSLAHLGKKVLIIDNAKNLGGAWGTIEFNNGEEVEIGCHIWSISRPVFEFIEQFLSIKLVRLNPQPIIYNNGRVRRYHSKANRRALRRLLSNIRMGRLANIRKDLKSPAYCFSFRRVEYVYPLKGAKEFSQALRDKVINSSIEILNDTTVNEVVREGENLKITLSNGSSLYADKIHLTSVSNLVSLDTKKNNYVPKQSTVNFVHVHLELSNHNGRAISFVRWLNDNMIHRISDISSQVKADNTRLIVVGIYEKVFSNDDEESIVGEIMNKLLVNEFIDTTTKLLSWQFNVYPTNYIDIDEYTPILEEFSGNIEIISTTDLIYSIHKRLNGWKHLINQ